MDAVGSPVNAVGNLELNVARNGGKCVMALAKIGDSFASQSQLLFRDGQDDSEEVGPIETLERREWTIIQRGSQQFKPIAKIGMAAIGL